jgi:2-deoxy-D-gluconate 3-dehydrogenase
MGDPVISNERSAEYYMQRIPLRRWGAGEDFEGPAVFLASSASQYMTGAELTVDGGISTA